MEESVKIRALIVGALLSGFVSPSTFFPPPPPPPALEPLEEEFINPMVPLFSFAMMAYQLKKLRTAKEAAQRARWEKRRKAAALVFLAYQHIRRLWLHEALNTRVRIKVASAALPSPDNSPACKLLNCDDEPSWIALCGFTKTVFLEIYEHFCPTFARMWQEERGPVSTRGRRASLYRDGDCTRVLLLALMFLITCTQQKVMCMLFGVSPSSLSRYLRTGLRALLSALKEMPEAKVRWPNHEEQDAYFLLIKKKYPDIKFRPFGFIDGLNLPVLESGDFFTQNADYNGYLAGTFKSNILVYAPDGTVIYAIMNLPGSYHDAWAATDLRIRMREKPGFLREGYCIVGDTAFPRTKDMEGKIVTPYKQDDVERVFHTATREELMEMRVRHSYVVSIRQAAEWGMREIQGQFARLRLPLPCDAFERQRMLAIIIHLHNLRARRVEINQIRTVYSPLWESNPLIGPRPNRRTIIPDIVI